MLGIHFFILLMLSADFFRFFLFKNNLSGTLSECQTVLIQIRTGPGPGLGPNCLQRLSADGKGHRQQGNSSVRKTSMSDGVKNNQQTISLN